MTHSFCLLLLTAFFVPCVLAGPAPSYVPVEWKEFVQVDGQPLPVPVQWLDTEEAKIAHSLKLPESVPKLVPFDFSEARIRALVPGQPNVTVQYFNHLCSTESGEWIFEKINKVEGFYQARPRLLNDEDRYLKDPYGPEAPWIERHFGPVTSQLMNVGLDYIEPPHSPYRYFEQPVYGELWQREAGISSPYVRIEGLPRDSSTEQGVARKLRSKHPMAADGIVRPTAKYAITWRGVRRERDREYHIAAGELLVYERETGKVIAVRRTFEATGSRSLWLLGPTCMQTPDDVRKFALRAFVLRVLDPDRRSVSGESN